MRKSNVTHLPTAVPSKRGGLPWAHEMTAKAMDMVQQMETVSRKIADGRSTDQQHVDSDLRAVMRLFEWNLRQVLIVLDEVQVVIEEVEPSVEKAVNA